MKLASARAGNVIGGGDWATDRVLPDCIRALQESEIIQIRNPLATRPWQHVLESLGGYLLLGSKLLQDSSDNLDTYCSGFNFGPYSTSNKTVEVFIQSFNQEIYNKQLTVFIEKKIREEMTFNSKEELVKQIKKDCSAVQKI